MARIAFTLFLLLTPMIAVSGDVSVYDEIENVIGKAFHETVADYDASIAGNPGDVVLAVRRCEMMDSFAYATDFYISEADDSATACYDDLLQRYPGHPEVELIWLNRLEADEAVAAANQLHDGWARSPGQSHHARIHGFLYERFRYDDENQSLAVHHCIRALKFDRASNCRDFAAEHFILQGEPDKAIALLGSPLDPHTEPYYLLQKIAALSRLGASNDVEQQYSQLDFEALGDYQFVELSEYLADVGMKHEAMAALNRVSSDYWEQEGLLSAQYRVAVALGDFEAALTHYNSLRDLGLHTDPFLRTRIELATHDPSLPWKARDSLAVLAIISVLLVLAALAWVVPALVHYRGLARKARAYAPGLRSSRWSLRHAGYVLFVTLFAAIFPLYLFEYDALLTEFSPNALEGADWGGMNLPRLMIWDTLITVALLLPLVLGRKRLREFWTRDWSVARCVGIGVLISFGLKIAYAIPMGLWSKFGSIGQTLTTEQVIAAMYRQDGIAITIVLIAIVVPLVEEMIFRGVLLQGFARHLTFRSANVLQSILFASFHDNMLAFPLFFAFAYIAGHLYRKSGGLLAGIVLHMVFNATAIAVLVGSSV